jgi:hypothetical protein
MNRVEFKKAVIDTFREYFQYSMIVVFYSDGSYSLKKEPIESIDIRIFLGGKEAKKSWLKEPLDDPLSVSFGIYGETERLSEKKLEELPKALRLSSSTANGFRIKTGLKYPESSFIKKATPSTNIIGDTQMVLKKLSEIFGKIKEQLIQTYEKGDFLEDDNNIVKEKLDLESNETIFVSGDRIILAEDILDYAGRRKRKKGTKGTIDHVAWGYCVKFDGYKTSTWDVEKKFMKLLKN